MKTFSKEKIFFCYSVGSYKKATLFVLCLLEAVDAPEQVGKALQRDWGIRVTGQSERWRLAKRLPKIGFQAILTCIG